MPSRAQAAAAGRGKARARRRRFRVSFWKLLVVLFLTGALVTAGMGGSFALKAYRDLPALASLEPRNSESSFLYDAHGQLITELHGPEHRVPVTLDEVPRHVVNAFVAIEDHRFFDHPGVDIKGILRAAYANFTGGTIREGASTITQQLARNAWLTLDQTYKRKMQEIFLALQLERFYTKDEILAMYLNTIFFGHQAYGIQAAAKVYFGKDVADLTVAEGAMLAAVARSAHYYSPYTSFESGLRRRNLVLEAMGTHGYLTAEEVARAKEEPVVLAGLRRPVDYPHPWFVDYVLHYLLEKYGANQVYREGLRVYTTLVPAVQVAAEEAIRRHLDQPFPLDQVDPKTGERVVQPEIGATFMDPRTGYILALVGGRQHGETLKLNRAWQAYRQTGSAFKPLIYAAALEMGYSPATIVDDWPTTYTLVDGSEWTFENYNRLYRGLTPYREGLALSINTMAVKVLEKVGIRTGFEYARRLGIDSLVERDARGNTDYTLSLALGALTRGTTTLEMARAFSAFANGGYRVDPIAILRVEDRHGNILEENRPHRVVAITEEAAFLMNSMLESTIQWGTGTPARLPDGRPAAGKTGTTSDDVDAWWVGYTPDFAGAIWMGYDQPKNMGGVWGGTYGAPIWRDVAMVALKDVPPSPFPRPRNIVEAEVCTRSGKLPGPLCPPHEVRMEYFVRGTEPRETCNVHVIVTVCGDHPSYLAGSWCRNPVSRLAIQRQQPWVPYTSLHEKTERVVTYIPGDASLEAPREYCPIHAPHQRPPFVGTTRDIKVYVWRYEFSPREIVVDFGDMVRLHFESTDVNHGFALPAFGIHEPVLAKKPVVIEFWAVEEGEFPFYSAVFSGPGWDRMTGKLIVRPLAGGN